jgi:glycosyltransferase involved in cell wall biosynthesis
MYCGNCFRDNALVAELRRMGHATLMVPLYLPVTLDEPDQSAATPTFFGGVNVFLDQKFPLYRRAPAWLRRQLDAPGLLRWAAGRAAKTRAAQVGDLTISMLRGEEGQQKRELDDLVAWLKAQSDRPDVVCLSNALLLGLAGPLRRELQAPVICTLQGEDSFLDALPPSHRELAWQTVGERARDAELCLAPSRYYADLMQKRLGLPASKVRAVWNGIPLDGYEPAPSPGSAAQGQGGPVLGFFARMCREKGLDLLVETFIRMKRGGGIPNLRLRVGGGCGPGDEPFVRGLRERLQAERLDSAVEFHPNLDRRQKISFYRSLTVLSVPALYGEAFGLYLLEAMAAGVPVVQPRHAAFPELVTATGGGLVCEPTAEALADTLTRLLLDPAALSALGRAGQKAVHENFSVARMAQRFLAECETVVPRQKKTAETQRAQPGAAGNPNSEFRNPKQIRTNGNG